MSAPEASFNENSASGLKTDFLIALGFLTRLPVDMPQGRTLAQSVRVFPLVGLLVGGLAGTAVWIGSYAGLHPLACAFLGLGVAMLLTGGLHEDGLADVADGFGGGVTRDKKLEILHDSRVGTYGVLALITVIGLKAGALSGVPGLGWAAWTLVAAHVLGRAAIPLVMIALDPAREDGLGHGAGRPAQAGVLTALLVGVLLVGIILGPKATFFAVALSAGALAILVVVVKNQIGGYTGDVLGTAEQVVETTTILAAAATLEWL